MKTSRQSKILDIIRTKDIETQNQLIEALEAAGFKSTQATVSRDIRELRLVKEMTVDGGYRYTLPSAESISGNNDKLRTIFRESIVSIDYAGNLVILKTLAGMASAACSAIDSMEISSIIGTIAGDDTIFLAVREVSTAEMLTKKMKEML